MSPSAFTSRIPTRLPISSGKSFNSSSEQSSGYVATRVLLPRNGVRAAIRFHPAVRSNARNRRVTGRYRCNGFVGVVVCHSCLFFLGLYLRQNATLQIVHSSVLHINNNSPVPFYTGY